MKNFMLFNVKISSILLLFIAVTSCGDKKTGEVAPPKVQVVEATEMHVPIYRDFVGQIYGELDIPIRARVSGWLEGIYFQEGREVTKGQLLYTIDSQPFEANVAKEKSKLAEAKTAFTKAQSDLNRIKPLAEINAVSKSDLDGAQASYDAALAYVDAAEASVELANIELSYCNMKAPISGLIGKTKARVGEFVGQEPNPVILNTVSKTDNVRVEFFLTESDYLTLVRAVHKAEAEGDEQARDKTEGNLQLILSDGSFHPNKGKVDFINREVDQETGSLLVQATFENPEGVLRPGQFSRVRVLMRDVPNALVVPQRCLSETQGVFNALVINENNEIVSRTVTVGPVYKDYYTIIDGLEVGEKLMLEGIQKARPGMKVEPVLTPYESRYSEELNK